MSEQMQQTEEELRAKFSLMSREELERRFLENLLEITAIHGRFRNPEISRPMHGGEFGRGSYQVTSVSIIRNGLYRVKYLVRDISTRIILSNGESVAEAISEARLYIRTIGHHRLSIFFGEQKAKQEAEDKARQFSLHEGTAPKSTPRTNIKSIPRRRRQIFEKSGGQCHYCQTPLTLDGKWHIEHQMPKALLGGDEPGNLVASCPKCNFEKRDLTAEEFGAKRAAKGAA